MRCSAGFNITLADLDELNFHTCGISHPYMKLLLRTTWKEYGTPDKDKIRKDFESGDLQKVIATTVWKEGVDFPDLEVVIRADGMSGYIVGIQMGGRLTRLSPKDKILIDFNDDFGPKLQDRADRRFDHYRKEGWQIENWDPRQIPS
jgi:superfamily II DNA or RNA helicase